LTAPAYPAILKVPAGAVMFKTQYSTELLKYLGAGLEFIITFGLFLGGGLALDWRIGSFPGFTLVGMVFGFVAAIYRLVKQGKEMNRPGHRSSGDDGKPTS
jgi:F0F1-type ATP synthase assembly protein I